jgi:serine/threonine-protein kinase
MYRQALEINRKALPAGHPTLALSLASLGQLLTAKGEAQAAEGMLREALEIRRKSLPAGHWRRAEAESALGECLVALKHWDEAEPLLLESYVVVKLKRGEKSRASQDCLKRIIKLYEGWGKPNKAAEYRASLSE